MPTTAIRGEVVSLRADPFRVPASEAIMHLSDGLIVIEDGVIAAVAPWSDARARDLDVIHYPRGIISAGFIDGHVHYPQTPMIGSFGHHLIDWLNRYTFVAEQAFADPAHAEAVAGVFLRELLRAGTTTAAVYCTVHPHSVDAFFAESVRLGTRMIAGKVLMDRNAPPALLDTAGTGYTQSRELIERWHGKGRQHYAVTPRFAPSSTPAQLQAAARLWAEHPGTYLQTHLNETREEIEWVLSLFPERASYLDVYDHYGLTGRARSSATACTWRRPISPIAMRPDRRCAIARRPTCSWARACFACSRRAAASDPCARRSAPISAPAPACRRLRP
jgi:guanine deaminase